MDLPTRFGWFYATVNTLNKERAKFNQESLAELVTAQILLHRILVL
jgi:hypothetical protein